MTDVATEDVTVPDTPMSGINVTVEGLQAKVQEIAELDELLAAASGSTALGKRALANSLVAEFQEQVNNLSAAVVAKLAEVETDPRYLTALVTGVDKAVTDRFGKTVDEFLTKEVENNSTDVPQMNEAELTELTNKARALRKQESILRDMLTVFDFDVSHIPVPKRLTGSRGKRGPRVFSRYDYFIDGQARTESQNSLSSIANTQAPDEWEPKTPKLKEFIAAQGIDINNPPDEWTVQLPNGKVLKAVKKSEEDVYSPDDEGDDNGEGNNDE